MTVGVISYISRDIVIKKYYNSRIEKIGGKAYYLGLTFSSLGIPTIILVHVDKNSQDLLNKLKKPNIELHNFISETPVHKNIYPYKNLDIRIWKKSIDNFKYSQNFIKGALLSKLSKCEYILLAPRKPQEIDLDFIKFLKENTSAKLVMDFDLFIKQVLEDGTKKLQSKEEIEKALPYFNIALIAEEDKPFLYNGSDEDLFKYLASKNVNEIILTKGSKGALIHSKENNALYKISAVKPKKLVDPTGAGDTFLAAYIAARSLGKKIQDAGNFAAKVASIKLEYKGAINKKIEIS